MEGSEFDDMDVSEQVIIDDSIDVVNKGSDDISKPSTSKAPEKTEKLAKLPLTRIKNLIKLDPDVSLASQDAVFVLAKATEMFITMLGREAYKFTKQNKKKTIQRKDIGRNDSYSLIRSIHLYKEFSVPPWLRIDECISSCECLTFLEGTIKDDV